jgi:hypothetical protein
MKVLRTIAWLGMIGAIAIFFGPTTPHGAGSWLTDHGQQILPV